MRSRELSLYVAAVSLLALLAVVALAAVSHPSGIDRLWLVAVFAGLIAFEHLFETRVAHRGDEGESTTHEESFLVALAMLAAPLSVAAALAAGFLAGNALRRRPPIKAFFNVTSFLLAAAAALLVIEAAGGAHGSTPHAAAAVIAGAMTHTLVNRLAVAGVLTFAGGGSFRRNALEDIGGRTLVASANISIGLLTGLAAGERVWTLPFGLTAMVVLHFALSGHDRARAQQQKLSDIVGSSSDGIVSLDRQGRVISWNPASERITGYGAAAVLGRPLEEVSRLLEAERSSYPETVSELLDTSQPQPNAVRIRAAGGEIRWLTISRAPLPEGGSVLVVRDDTIRRQMDEMLSREEQERLRADLVAAVSHELRTPLTSILGFTQTLLHHESDEESRRRYLGIMEKEGTRLRNLIDDLLDLRQISEGRFRVEARDIDLREVLTEQVELASAQSETREIALDVPPEPMPVRGEHQRLGQVVANLISNAIKYSPDGEAVHVSVGCADDDVRVSVRDSGFGIPAEQQAQIFTRFFRVDSPLTRDIGGTGLGLTLCREIVEAHGGRIGFESVEGQGSTFYFVVPRARGFATSSPAPPGAGSRARST